MAAEIPNDIPGNSKKQQQNYGAAKGQQNTDGRPPVPTFEGPTAGVKRKQEGALWKWIKRNFLSDRKPKDIIMEVIEQRIVPGIKDNVRNSTVATIDSFVYGGSSAPATIQNNVSYNKIYSGQTQSSAPVTRQQPQTKADEINAGFSNPCFKDRQTRVMPDGTRVPGALDFLAMIKNYDFPTLSVHTLYLMQKKHIDYTWDAYGWNREEILALGPDCIKPTGNTEWPFMIVLPEAHMIS